MITEAERMSNVKQNKLYCKRSHNDRNDKDSHKISSLRMGKHSRSRSRDRAEKYNISDYSSQCRAELKQSYQRPKDNDDYCQQTVSVSSRMKNWKKDKIDEKGRKVIELPASEPKEIDLGNINSVNEVNENKGIDTCVLTEAEMNKLGARIVKAELMGDNVCFLL